MENNINDLDDSAVAAMIYEKVNAYWSLFPNIWKYCTKHDIAALSAIDLYKCRKDNGVPHILHYFRTKGERSLKPLIGVVTYNVMQHEARYIHSTGIYNNEMRRNVMQPISLDAPSCYDADCDELAKTLYDIIEDGGVSVEKEVDYVMLYKSLPNKVIENVFYKDDGKYNRATYKRILKDILDGYTLTLISNNLFKVTKSGDYVPFRELGSLVKQMKSEIKDFLLKEYNYGEEDYRKGCNIL